MYRSMTPALKEQIITELVVSNSSIDTAKVIAKKFNVDPGQVITLSKRNRSHINALKLEHQKHKEEEEKKRAADAEKEKLNSRKDTVNGVYMEFGKDNIPNDTNIGESTMGDESKKPVDEDEIYIPRTKEDMQQKKPITTAQKWHFAKIIEAESTLEGGRREISRAEVTRLGRTYFICEYSAVAIVEEYTSVKVIARPYSKSIRKSTNKRSKQLPDKDKLTEKGKIIVDDLQTTSLTQLEISELNECTTQTIEYYMRTYLIIRPFKEDSTVKAKTKRRKEELRRRLELKAAQKDKKENTSNVPENKQPEAATSIKDLVKDINVPNEATIQELKKIQEEKKPEEKNIGEKKTELVSVTPSSYKTPTVPEPEDKPDTLIDLLNDRSIHRIVADTYLDVMEFTNRHGMPCRIGVFDNEFNVVQFDDYDGFQNETAIEFLKQNLKFNKAGMANKTVRLFLTGNQSAFGAVMHACHKLKVNLKSMNYNTKTRAYKAHTIIDDCPVYNDFGLGVSAISKAFGNNLYRYKCTIRDIEQATNPLLIAVCDENNKNTECAKRIAIVCSSEDDYDELFDKITSIAKPIRNTFQGFYLAAHRFNFNSNGDVIKDEITSEFSTKPTK